MVRGRIFTLPLHFMPVFCLDARTGNLENRILLSQFLRAWKPTYILVNAFILAAITFYFSLWISTHF